MPRRRVVHQTPTPHVGSHVRHVPIVPLCLQLAQQRRARDGAGRRIVVQARKAEAALELVRFMLAEEAQNYFAQSTYEYPLARGISPAGDLIPLGRIETPDMDLGDDDDFDGDDELLTYLVRVSDERLDQMVLLEKDPVISRDALIPSLCYDLLQENVELRKMCNQYQLRVLLLYKG